MLPWSPTNTHTHRHIVLDEADQMLEIGFADSVEEILAASFQCSKFTHNHSLEVLCCTCQFCNYNAWAWGGGGGTVYFTLPFIIMSKVRPILKQKLAQSEPFQMMCLTYKIFSRPTL